MTAPRGVELEEYVFVVVHNDVFVVVGYNNLNGAFLLLWDRLRLDAWLDLSIDEILDERTNVFLGELLSLVERVLLILDGFLDGESRPLANF